MIPTAPDVVPTHRVPLVAFGLPRRRYGIDDFARRELTDHIDALCAALHTRTPGDCPACARLTEES
ncbi:MAG TPA: hypothetical protein VNT51_00425 [Miltoncostaeaceae bacterium]|nr:hypothetical protein [Miltoncostaeaceae bacterium]